MESLYVINVSNKEYVDLVNDVVRMMTIQFVIQILYCVNSDDVPFFSLDFVLLLLYVALGVCVYWMVIKKLVSFK